MEAFSDDVFAVAITLLVLDGVEGAGSLLSMVGSTESGVPTVMRAPAHPDRSAHRLRARPGAAREN